MSTNIRIETRSNGMQICYSYNVPVAAFIPEVGYVMTDKKYSVTTSKHANKFTGKRGAVLAHEYFLQVIGVK